MIQTVGQLVKPARSGPAARLAAAHPAFVVARTMGRAAYIECGGRANCQVRQFLSAHLICSKSFEPKQTMVFPGD